MRAVLLAGGKGRRLLPYTTIFPKPLMPLGDRPILETVVKQLRRAGFDHITMAVGHLAGLIEAYFRDGSHLDVRIDYSREDEPLGTAGPLSLIARPSEDFLVMNGDLLTDLDFTAMMAAHRSSGAIATLGVYQKSLEIALGVLQLGADDSVLGYTEKPTLTYEVSTGIYCFRPEVLDQLEPGRHCDLPELVLRLIAAGQNVKSFRVSGYWLDIGRPEDYEVALSEYAKGRFD